MSDPLFRACQCVKKYGHPRMCIVQLVNSPKLFHPSRYLSKIPTLIPTHFLLSRSGNSFLTSAVGIYVGIKVENVNKF